MSQHMRVRVQEDRYKTCWSGNLAAERINSTVAPINQSSIVNVLYAESSFTVLRHSC